jgi:hypothetical protein
MMNIRHLIRMQNGVYVNPADADYKYKMIRFGRYVPANPLEEAKAYAAAGLRQKAKEIYLRLLQHKESLGIHRELAVLLSYREAKSMKRKYLNSPAIKRLYQERMRHTNPVYTAGRHWAYFLPLAVIILIVLWSIDR